MKFIGRKIKDAIAEGLPGIEAQKKLAPEVRNLYPKKNCTTDAAILILMFKDFRNEINIVFIKRQPYDGVHSAQISFPGGKVEKSDKSLYHTALRESKEEIGIDTEKIELIGKLTELYIPVSNFIVHPYIGISTKIPTFTIDKTEVDYIITYPIHELIIKSVSKTKMEHKGKLYQVPFYNIKGEMIWGATAMILSEFIAILKRCSLD